VSRLISQAAFLLQNDGNFCTAVPQWNTKQSGVSEISSVKRPISTNLGAKMFQNEAD